MIKLIDCIRIKQRGVITLTLTSAALMATTLATFYSSKSVKTELKIYNNSYQGHQAFTAAEGGLDYAIQGLVTDPQALSQGMTNGNINMNTTSMSLANGAGASMSYSNPIQNDATLIKVSSVGASNDQSITRTISQLVKYKPIVSALTLPDISLIVKGTFDMQGSPTVDNPTGTVAVWTGGNASVQKPNSITFSGQSGMAGVASNDGGLSGASNDSFYTNFFGTSMEKTKGHAQQRMQYYTAAEANANINGEKRKLFYIDGNLHLNSNTTLGTQQEPIVLVVDGDFKMNGNTVIYGFVFVKGNLDKGNGSSTINGTIAVNGNAIMRGNMDIVYDQTVIDNLGNQIGAYYKVPGTWRDM